MSRIWSSHRPDSRSVLETGTATPTTAADVYAVGASFFISATGLRPLWALSSLRPRPLGVLIRGCDGIQR